MNKKVDIFINKDERVCVVKKKSKYIYYVKKSLVCLDISE